MRYAVGAEVHEAPLRGGGAAPRAGGAHRRGAAKLGVSRKQLSELVNARSGISPEMAIRLDKAFGGGADTWLRMQAAYDLAQAMKKADRIRVERITGEPVAA